MKTTYQKLLCKIIPILVGFLADPLIQLAIQIFVGKINIFSALKENAQFHFYLLLSHPFLAFFTLAPYILLSAYLEYFLTKHTLKQSYLVCFCGLIGILSLTIPGYAELWLPAYNGGHFSSTSILAYGFVPLYSIGTLALGIFMSFLLSFIPWFKK